MPLATPSELRLAELLNHHLDAVRGVIEDASALVRGCGAALERAPHRSAAIEAQLSLLPRVADALRGVAILASYGHELPALALSSVVYELGHLSAWIGPDDGLARTWLEWKEATRMPKGWGWQNVTRGALVRTGRGDSATVFRQGLFYSRACLAKHGNPIALRNRPAALTPDMAVLNADPAFTPASGNDTVTAFMIAGTSGLVAVDSFWLSFPNAVTPALLLVRTDVAHSWNAFARAWAERPRAPAS
jgi:hypothetical protein